jgi:hypothetical protein
MKFIGVENDEAFSMSVAARYSFDGLRYRATEESCGFKDTIPIGGI